MCYHELQAWQAKKQFQKILGKKPVFVNPKDPRYEKIKIPCGQCIGCRLAYSRDWATRIALEANKTPGRNWFITLTYAPEHLPINQKIWTETGEIIERETLVPEDLSAFMKNLRRNREYHHGDQAIKFYGCGEYGSLGGRPHYHICIMNMSLEPGEVEPWFLNQSGQQIYKSKVIEAIWKKGLIGIGEVTWESAAYVARYMLKKQKGEEAKKQEELGKKNEFVRMSRRPGIAAGISPEELARIYKTDQIIIPGKRPKKVKPPKYYDKLFDLQWPEEMAKIKEKRKEAAKEALKNQLSKTSLDEKNYIRAKEETKIEQIKALKRQLKEE